ncbi:MAG: hypothetical protein HWE15_10855 [Algoriphagus sp.]|uniref:hypothetical protein n=1 Tax=Algoriphagus sp. TaxID=1872435 RepID=UPI0017B886E9|nr:hypothetical protein [Algoriphagus sp.]NVJ86795.1 hypothetical protein [Algoriphagus sp.]
MYIYFLLRLDFGFGSYYGDEIFYQKNSESFYQSGELSASFTYSGKGSKIGGFDAHGPAYPLLYSFLLMLKASPSFHIPLTNLLVFGITIFALAIKRTHLTQFPLQLLLILGSPFTLFYGFSYMPELIHFSIGIGLYLLFSAYFKHESPSNLWFLLIGIGIAGLFRSTWFFAWVALGISLIPKKKWLGLGLMASGIGAALFYSSFFYEQTPNVFSNSLDLIQLNNWGRAIYEVYFNTKRNIYFLLHYTEGKYYWVWKIWVLVSLIFGLIYQKKSKLIRLSTLLLLIQLAFSVIIYKTYEWTDWRMLSPVTMLLNLGLIENRKLKYPSWLLVGLSLASFFLILPFQQKIIGLRNDYTLPGIEKSVIEELKNLDQALIRIHPFVLEKYQLEELPLVNHDGNILRYILPFYELDEAPATHRLEIENHQLIIRSENILAQ